MPHKDPEARRASQRRTMARRYARRRGEAIDRLGGECVRCGADESLEFDHVDPAEKSFSVGQHWHRKWDVLLPEIDKCQLLCRSCHMAKTAAAVAA